MSTTTSAAEDMRYPVGKFQPVGEISEEQRKELVKQIAETPMRLRAAVHGLSEEQLNTPYRPGGWTVRQVVHHLFDSHANSYIRFKLALTEEQPTIKPFDENRWSELPDAKSAPVEASLALMDGLHRRWVIMMEGMTPQDWKRTFRHPERGVMSLETTLGLYAWHGRHHVAHITELRRRMGW